MILTQTFTKQWQTWRPGHANGNTKMSLEQYLPVLLFIVVGIAVGVIPQVLVSDLFITGY